MLGFGPPESAPCCANFGQGAGQIWMDNVACNGDEANLEDCAHNGWGSHNCAHGEDASVVCGEPTVRLVGGANDNEGRVEILHDGVWGTVCDDSWGIEDARVVCRQLGLGDALAAPCCADNGQGAGQIWMDNVNCQGNEANLEDCGHNGWGSHNCAHSEDASVVCEGRDDGGGELDCLEGEFGGVCITHISTHCIPGVAASEYCAPYGRLITEAEFRAAVAGGWVRPNGNYHTMAVADYAECAAQGGYGSVGIPGWRDFGLYQCGDTHNYCNRSAMCVADGGGEGEGEGEACGGWEWNDACWYTAPNTGMTCTQVCADHCGFDAAGSTHVGNQVGQHFWPNKANGGNWVHTECSSTDNNTNWGANGGVPDPNWSHNACHVNCACGC